MQTKEKVLTFLKSCSVENWVNGGGTLARSYDENDNFKDLDLNVHLLDEINEPIQSIEKITPRLIVFNLTTKCIVLHANDDNGDQGCDSISKFGDHDFSNVIGLILRSTQHKNVTTEYPDEFSRIMTHTYELLFDNNYKYDFNIINESNGYYDSYLEVFVCSL